jgi:hypothetical protein
MVHHQRINASANEVAAFTRVCSVLFCVSLRGFRHVSCVWLYMGLCVRLSRNLTQFQLVLFFCFLLVFFF